MGPAQGTETNEASKVIELEAPEFLETGQNFFDQAPFVDIIEKTSQATAITQENLRPFLRSCAQTGADHESVTTSSQELSEKMRNAQYDPYMQNLNPREPGKVKEYRQAIQIMGTELANFPSWHEYIVTQCVGSSNYKNDGSYFEKAHGVPPIESYAKWISRRLEIDNKSKLLGLQEVLPQGFQQEIEQPDQTGKNRQNRRWQILKASELVPTR